MPESHKIYWVFIFLKTLLTSCTILYFFLVTHKKYQGIELSVYNGLNKNCVGFFQHKVIY